MEQYPRDWLSQRIVSGAQDAMIFADREGVIHLWNSGAEALFGYSPSEAVGQTLDLIVPERFRERHWEGYHRVMETGVSRYGREVLAVPAQRRDGSRVSVEFTIVLLMGEEGKPLGAAAIMRDVTERWQRERDLRQHVAKLEAKVAEKG
ncbi:MAG: PAS domain S-box protein [Chloroflexi bacterium]|nr:PAS domain S-box protein [Chloroflexota bacterium]